MTSRSDSPTPCIRTPPRKSCVSFAAAQPKSCTHQHASITAKADIKPQFKPPDLASDNNSRNESRGQTIPSPINTLQCLATVVRPIFGSVFDDFEEEKLSPVFLDNYRAGQPKKLVDDCLKKENELRESSVRDDQGRDDEDYDIYLSEVEEEDDKGADGSEDEAEIASESDRDGQDFDQVPVLHPRSRLCLDTAAISRCILSPVGVYTPSRDIVDNFVPGTLDEDQIERLDERCSTPSPHDIDPTYPSEDEEDIDHQTQPCVPFISPVRFMARSKVVSSRQPVNITTPSRANRLNRTHSLPWGGKAYMANQKPLTTKVLEVQQPRRGAIPIVQSVEHASRRHHRRERKDTGSAGATAELGSEEKGIGAVAMAAMARQLTNRHGLDLWALSL